MRARRGSTSTAVVTTVATLMGSLAAVGLASAPSATADSPRSQARGLIIGTSIAGSASLARSLADAASVPGVEAVESAVVAPRTSVVRFDGPATQAQVAAAVAQVRREPGVAWVQPDMPVHLESTRYLPSDPRFGEEWDLWDSQRTNGGFSLKAPLIWSTTLGSPSVVVAVLDTGITSHPDLAGQTVPGRDFVSDPLMANDGDGWDADPADPGDWLSAADLATSEFSGCGDPTDSSWHGTHVAGTVAAAQDNGIGVTGVAPHSKVQMVRVLGKCGGYDSDIIAGITWASGGTVQDPDTGVTVPANPTPARVINMSLGGTGTCGQAYINAISAARARGTTIVAAAGNESTTVGSSIPANCPGVISVTATGRTGQLAYYSNYGTASAPVTLAAPGGDTDHDSGILSTWNSGTTSPGAPTYDFMQGTSMATPHVAGAAALVYSSGVSSPTQVQQILSAAVQPFPSYGSSADCTVIRCGAGILDLSRLAIARAPNPPTEVDATLTGTTAAVSWSAPSDSGSSPVTSYDVQQSIDAGAWTTWASGLTSTGATVTGLVPGSTYAFRVAARNSAGLSAWSDASAVVSPGRPSEPLAVSILAGNAQLSVAWSAPADDGGSPVLSYQATASPGGASCTTSGLTCAITGLTNGVSYTVTVVAANANGTGTPSTPTVAAAPQAPRLTPGPVRNLTVRITWPSSRARATFAWRAPLDSGASPVRFYRARYQDVGGTWSAWGRIDGTSAFVAGLRRGVTYRVQVVAVNTQGAGQRVSKLFTPGA